jgi:AcrR family transcriptional regulator
MTSTRTYVMTARAEGVAQTRERILRAAIGLTGRRPLAGVSLADIADDAGVSVQTVLRQFGSRGGVIDAGTELALGEITEELRVPQADLPAAIAVMVDHHEARGDTAILLLGQEAGDAHAARITALGRATHRSWVESVFTPLLGDLTRSEREEMIDMLVVVTDVYTWKILRRDRKLSRKLVEHRMLQLAEIVLSDWML